jgi:cytochrome c-type biogenesis protein CcmH
VTIIFWVIASTMTILVLGLLLWPLLKRAGGAATGEEEKILSIFRQQFAELAQDQANGVLTDELYQQARRELERRLLEETGSTETTPKIARRQMHGTPVALALAIIVPTASGLLYWQLGNPLAMTEPPAASLSAQGEGSENQFSDGLSPLIERLKQKMEQNPNDGVGWALLARSYMGVGRYPEAALAYENATALIPDDAQLLADYADAMGVLHGRKLEGKPEALIQQALKIDPRNVKALMLAGTVAFNRNNFARAAQDWELARANLPADTDPEMTQQLVAAIEEAKSHLGGGQDMIAASAEPAAASVPPAKQTGQPRTIRGTVTMAPSLAGKGSPTDTLFVFARQMNGPPMPVSIVRATRKDLPFTFQLDDSTSPMPSRKLSSAGPVVIVARLSKSGQAMPQEGDLEGVSQPVQSGVDGLTVVIDRERPYAESAPSAQPAGQVGQPRMIRGTVTMAPGLAGKGSPTDTLFVFARETSGPPMPVSIVRATKNDLPFTFQLDDSTSPMPSRKLSSAGPVVIVARLSKSGQAMPQSGDLEGMSQPVQSGVDGLTVVIDRERP